MNRKLLRGGTLLLAVLALSPLAVAREKVQGWCEQGNQTVTTSGLTSTSKVQGSFPTCIITVWDVGTMNLSSIFSDDVGTVKANPFTASADGLWFFYADNARYDVQLSGGGIATPFTLSDISLDDATQLVTTVTSVASSPTPSFDASAASIFTNTLTANVTSSTITGGVAGQIITLYILQDGTGGWTFAFPANVTLRTATFVVSDDASAVSSLTTYFDGTNWREIGRTHDEVGRDLLPVATGRNLGSAAARWDAFLQTLDVATTSTLTGNVTFGASILPVATGQDIGASGFRPDGIFDLMTVGLWNSVRVVDGNKFATIQAAANDIPVGGQGTVFIPAGEFVISTCLDPGDRGLTLQGAGWGTQERTPFGGAGWLIAGAVDGTVLKVTGTNGAICVSAANRRLHLRDLAILGPGTGTSIGVDVSVANTSLYNWNNVGIFNFSTGLRIDKNFESSYQNLSVFGSTTGILIGSVTGDITTQEFINPNIAANATGIDVQGGNGIRIRGGVVEGQSVRGIRVEPVFANVTDYLIDGTWFELNTNADIELDTTAFGITSMLLSQVHASTDPVILFTGTSAINRLTLIGSNFGGWTAPVFPSHVGDSYSILTNFPSTITVNGQLTVLGEAGTTSVVMRLPDVSPIVAENGTAIIGAQVGNVEIGRWGGGFPAAVSVRTSGAFSVSDTSFVTHFQAAANGDVIAGDPAGSGNGQFKWYDGTTFQGIHAHANSANRTYTFPDTTGTLPLLNLAQTFSAEQSFSSGITATGGVVEYTDAPTLAASTTPSVTGGNVFLTANTASITDFTGEQNGQVIILLCGADTTTSLTDSTPLFLAGAFTCSADDTITLVSNGTVWFETSRSVN